MLIDNNLNLIIYIFENEDRANLNIESVMKVIEVYETEYTEIFDLDKTITIELTNQTISKKLDEIDVWTLIRIKNKLLEKLDLDMDA
jgi:hypothetical protein